MGENQSGVIALNEPPTFPAVQQIALCNNKKTPQNSLRAVLDEAFKINYFSNMKKKSLLALMKNGQAHLPYF